MNRRELVDQLLAPDPQPLFAEADRVRRTTMGDAVMVRGLIEWSNQCGQNCLYCGLRHANQQLTRYRMSDDEVLTTAREAFAHGYGTVILQAGEDAQLRPPQVAKLVVRMREGHDGAITLSLGEWPDEALDLWRDAGTDRYLLKFETANPALYARLRPGRQLSERLSRLAALRCAGYQVGSGNMIGLPGQTIGDVADDLLLAQNLELDMTAIGPFLPHPATPLAITRQGRRPLASCTGADTLARDCDLCDITLRAMALGRLLLPQTLLPATTALGTLTPLGRERGLGVGANVLMQDITPQPYRRHYEIYPNRVCLDEQVAHCRSCMAARVHSVGRTIAGGRGDAPRLKSQAQSTLPASDSRLEALR
jgi:biotin synthase